jgi:two-component SAPR family response regulator
MMSYAKKSVLVLEDQAITALDIEDILLEIGFLKISIITSCADAESWLTMQLPDLAIIDVHLRDGVCEYAARMLVDNGVPFIVHSAFDTQSVHEDSVFSKGTWVSKPSLPDLLGHVVRQTLFAA